VITDDELAHGKPWRGRKNIPLIVDAPTAHLSQLCLPTQTTMERQINSGAEPVQARLPAAASPVIVIAAAPTIKGVWRALMRLNNRGPPESFGPVLRSPLRCASGES